MVPTVLESLGIEPPESIHGVTQSPMEGVSFAHTFDDATTTSKRITQYFEMLGHRSIYHDGWRAVCPWPGTSFTESGRKFGTPITYEMLIELDAKGWELYNIVDDPAETKNLAVIERNRLIAMIGMWYTEAGKYNVLPIDGRGVQRISEERPQIAVNRNRYVLYPHTQAVPATAAPKILNRPYSITAEVDVRQGGAEGVLLSMGGNDGGISFYVKNGILCYVYNYMGMDHYYVKSDKEIQGGHHFLSIEFEPTGKPDFASGKGSPGTVKLLVDGIEIGRGDIPVTAPFRLGQGAAMLVGADTGGSVTPEYEAPFHFTGTLKRVIVDVSGKQVEDYEAAMKVVLAKQ
jgi:arylsulfatase